MLSDMKLNEFVDDLSSNSPAPGGGSVAALCASLASALGSMVFNLTVGKKVYEQSDSDIKCMIDESLNKCSNAKDEFLTLMNEDTDVFMELMRAFKLPKENDEQKCIRNKKIQEGYKKAANVPLNVAQKAFALYHYIMTACKYGNKNAVSDAGVAAILIQSSIESAVLNVKINLGSIKDEDYIKMTSAKCDDLLIKGADQKSEILDIVNNKI